MENQKFEKLSLHKPYRIGNIVVSVVKEGSIPVPAFSSGSSGCEGAYADNPRRVAEILRAFRGPHVDQKEHFIALLLNTRNQVIGINEVSVGTLSASLVHPREVFRPAILIGAASIIVSHNHPSEDCAPSPEDKVATRRIRESGELLGIPVLDHVILADSCTDGGAFFSFRENGMMG